MVYDLMVSTADTRMDLVLMLLLTGGSAYSWMVNIVTVSWLDRCSGASESCYVASPEW